MRFLFLFVLTATSILSFALEKSQAISTNTPNFVIYELSKEPAKNFQLYLPEGFIVDSKGSTEKMMMYFRKNHLNQKWIETITFTFLDHKMSAEDFFSIFKLMQLGVMGKELIEERDHFTEKDGVKRGEMLISGPLYDADEKLTPIRVPGFDQASGAAVIQYKGNEQMLLVTYAVKFPSSRKSKAHSKMLLEQINKVLQENVIVSGQLIPPSGWTNVEKISMSALKDAPVTDTD